MGYVQLRAHEAIAYMQQVSQRVSSPFYFN
jgi:hypothetical protein